MYDAVLNVYLMHIKQHDRHLQECTDLFMYACVAHGRFFKLSATLIAAWCEM